MNARGLPLALLLVVLPVLPVAAQTLAAPPLTRPLDREVLLRRVGRPPAPGSVEEREDLAILRWLQRSRSAAEASRSWALLEWQLSAFDRAAGAQLQRYAPTISAGLAPFLRLVTTANDAIKERLPRPRPYLSHPDLVPCLPREGNLSFPSGHASWSRAAGLLLADLLPERRERLEVIGLRGGYDRVLCGVHYPSDVRAGQRLAEEAVRQIVASPEWQRFRGDPAVQAERRWILDHPPAGGLPEL